MMLNMLDERPHRLLGPVFPPGMAPVGKYDFGMQSGLADTEVEIDIVHQVFEEAFASIFRGEVENDDFNRLVLAARLPATEIVVLRAYAKYLRQIGFALSQAFIQSTLAAHPSVAHGLIELFKTRLDPELGAGAGARSPELVRAIGAAPA